ncbi:TadE/TadG family type IV pilus assembly protein [Qipengyuania sp. RANM35]|uniref:TadE/TadG family type IV pilus assembly protein n=1 Tax=Qipengyuania sp. RANM35 TaxID=3068635 RepID=UPI0034DB6E46
MISRIAKRLASETRGNATLELAFATPILLTMALASVDATMGFMHRMKMQQYAQVGADYIYAKMESVPLDPVIKAEMVLATGLPANKITVTSWIECDSSKANQTLGICNKATAVVTKFVKIEVKDTYTPILNIPGYANYVKSFDYTGHVTVQTQ